MNDSKKSPLILFSIVVLLAGVALLCQIASASQGGTPLPTSVVNGTAPSREFLSLGSAILTQSGQSPDYTITTNMPVMNGSGDPHVVTFNKAISALVQKQVEAFKADLKQVSVQPAANGSSFNLQFTPVAQSKQVVSLQLVIDEALDGAAHPTRRTVVFNYDLEHDQEISIDRLFRPGTNYLQSISDYCKAELGKRKIGFDSQQHGADPTPENYRNWNIGTDSLVITFDAGQVADYNAGQQVVFVPYSVLKSLIDPQGPLAQLNP